jgi:hypothetical protein
MKKILFLVMLSLFICACGDETDETSDGDADVAAAMVFTTDTDV